MARPLLPFLALPTLLLSPPAAAQGFDLFGPPGVGLARLADADASGDVSAEERAAFLAAFAEQADGTLERGAVLARCIAGGLDVDGDGAVTGDDVEAALAGLDVDGDGAISAAEAEPVNGAAATGFGAARWLMAGIAFSVADEDLSKDLSAAEWDTFRPTAPVGAALDMERLASWTIVAQRNVPEVRSAFTPSILLATLGASLDSDRNGSLSRADLDGLMLALDADGNGALSADELRPQRGGGRGNGGQRGWEISDEVAALPPGMKWQRDLADALALVRRTGKPLLICVNMDGEPASDNLAAGRYRDPAFLALARGFVCVAASPDRHTERDHDDRGVRLPCARFGTLVEQEHIDIEPDLFARYFNEQRVAPRHVGVSPQGEILFDLFLLNDFTVIDAALQEHGFFDAAEPDYSTLPIGELLDVPDAAARELLEGLMVSADETGRVGLAALSLDGRRATQHPELVRLGLRDESQAVRRVTLDTMIREAEKLPLDLAPEALSIADAATRTRLVDALARRAASAGRDADKVRARRLARIFAAASAPKAAIDPARWRVALAGGAGASGPAVASAPDARLDALARLESMLTDHPDDADLNALRAATLLAQARFLITNGGGNPSFFLEDARLGAERALELRPGHALAGATLAGACWFLSDYAGAGDAAANALPGLLGFAGSPIAAETLGYLAQARTRQLYAAFGKDPVWPAAWVHEALAAHEVLLAHPLGTEAQALAGLQLLGNLELNTEQRAFATGVLERFPASGDAHNWFRFVFLRDLGADGLVEAYDNLRVPADAEANGLWYAGFGRLLAGDRLVREGRGATAPSVYAGAAADLRASGELEPTFEASVVQYLGMVHCGAARARLDCGDLAGALEELQASLAANPAGLEIENGLGETPMALGNELVAACLAAGESDRALAVEEVLGAGIDR